MPSRGGGGGGSDMPGCLVLQYLGLHKLMLQINCFPKSWMLNKDMSESLLERVSGFH